MLSVIVPVYNAENYLNKCIDSILAQTYNDIEVILVDDGSTDSSLNICQEFAKRDNRVKVFHKSNGGSTSAYILGIEESVGSYITFVDSDDWIEPSMYEKMLKYFDIKDVNMVICKYDTIIDNIGIESNFGIKEGVLGQADKYKFFHSPNTLRIPVSRWNKIYVNSDIKDMIKFLDGSICFAEDNLFNLLFVMKYLQNAYYLDEVLYHYNYNINSVSAKFNGKKLRDLNKVYELLRAYDVNKEYETLINESLVRFVDTSVFPTIMKSDSSSNEKISMIKKIMKQNDFRNAAKTIKWKTYNIKQFVKKILIKNALAKCYYYMQSKKYGKF